MKKQDKALLAATINGNVEGVKAAIAAAADIHVSNDEGTALKFAATDGYTEIVRILMAAGPHTQTDKNEALYCAADYGHAEIVSLLLAAGADVHDDDDAALFTAILNGHAEVVRALLVAGADVHVHDEYALLTAACKKNTEMVRLLLAAGANPVVPWLTADKGTRILMRSTFDACADAMTPEQRNALVKRSNQWVRLRAMVATTPKNKVLHRR